MGPDHLRPGAPFGSREALPGAYPGPDPFLKDPPEPPRATSLCSRGALDPPWVTSVPPKDLSKCRRSACSKPWKYECLASRDLKKQVSCWFLGLPDRLRTAQSPRPFSLGSPQVTQNAPRDRPGTPKEPPRPAQGSPRGPPLTLRAPVQDSAAARGDLEHLGKAPGTKKRKKRCSRFSCSTCDLEHLDLLPRI